MNRPNIGWLYTRNYFKVGDSDSDLEFKWLKDHEKLKLEKMKPDKDEKEIKKLEKEIKEIKEKNSAILHIKNQVFLKISAGNYNPEISTSLEREDEKRTNISLKTIYPGLLIGAGYNHETTTEGEYKLGLQFDHTTGLPYIPGHSVKGVLKHYLNCEVECDENGNKKTIFDLFYNEFLVNQKLPKADSATCKKLLVAMFPDNDQNSMYAIDIYHDAFIDKSNTLILSSDYITPHKDQLKEPIPLALLKIKEDVTINFYFDLKETKVLVEPNSIVVLISADAKKAIFEMILKEFGIGAKTNVGYGQLIDPNANPETLIYDKIVEDVSPHYKSTSNTNKPPQNFITDKSKLKQGAIIKGKVTANLNSTLKFELPDFPGLKCNDFRYGNSNAFSIGSDVSLTIANVSGSYPNILSINVNNPRKF